MIVSSIEQQKSSLRLSQHASVTDIRIGNINMSWFSFVIRPCKWKEKSFQSMLEILVPPGRTCLVGPGLPRGCWMKEWSSIMHPRLGGVCSSCWSCREERGISDSETGCWASQRRNSLACTAAPNGNWANVIGAINTRGMDSRKGSSSVAGLLICSLASAFPLSKLI